MTALQPRIVLMLTLPPLLWAGNAVVGRLMVGSVPPLALFNMKLPGTAHSTVNAAEMPMAASARHSTAAIASCMKSVVSASPAAQIGRASCRERV